MLELTPWGQFIMQYTVCNDANFWNTICERVKQALDNGDDWMSFLDEIIAGCTELRDGKLQEILCVEDEQTE